MLTSELLDIIKQKVGEAVAEIGGDNPTYRNEFLLRYVKTADFVLRMQGVDTAAGGDALTIDPTSDTITPEPLDDSVGVLLAFHTAASIVLDDLTQKLRDGELGLSFSTGATQITTNQAAITLRSSGMEIRREANMLLTLYLSGDPNAVTERLQ